MRRPTDKLALDVVQERAAVTAFDVASALVVYPTTARRALQRLVAKGLVTATWEKNVTVYRPAARGSSILTVAPTAQGSELRATARDSRVLAELPATAAQVSERTGIPRNLVFGSLNRLRSKGLAEKTRERSLEDGRSPVWRSVDSGTARTRRIR